MIDPFTIMLLAGTALSAYSSIAEGEAQANAAANVQAIREREALETLARLEINRRSILKEGERVRGAQLLGFAKSGIDIGSDTVLSMLENTNAEMTTALYNTEREAYFRADSLRTEGALAASRGSELRQAGQFGALSSILTAGYRAKEGGLFDRKTPAPSFYSSEVDSRPFSPELFNTNRVGIRYIG